MDAEKFYTICDKVEHIIVPDVDKNLLTVKELDMIRNKGEAEYFLPLLAYMAARPLNDYDEPEQKITVKKYALQLCTEIKLD